MTFSTVVDSEPRGDCSGGNVGAFGCGEAVSRVVVVTLQELAERVGRARHSSG